MTGSTFPTRQSLYLQVPALGLQPVVDEALRISGKTQHELTLGLQLVNCLYCFMDLKEISTATRLLNRGKCQRNIKRSDT